MGRDTRSTAANVWHAWYNTTRWRRIRAEHLRDSPLCVMCLPHVVAATVCDHVLHHKGDPDLFWNGPKQSLCATHHSSVKQAEEKGSLRTLVDEDGWPIDPAFSWRPSHLRPSKAHLTIVCGAPASGKSRYIQEHSSAHDIVIDLDMYGPNGKRFIDLNRDERKHAGMRRNKVLESLAHMNGRHAWFIVGEPHATWRDWWQRTLKASKVVVIETSERECIRRARLDPTRTGSLKAHELAISDWWSKYSKRAADTIVNAD